MKNEHGFDLSLRVESPVSPMEGWNCESTYYDVWHKAVENTLGRTLTGRMVPGQARYNGESGLAEQLYHKGTTVEQMVSIVNTGLPRCEICGDNEPTKCTVYANCLNVPMGAEMAARASLN